MAVAVGGTENVNARSLILNEAFILFVGTPNKVYKTFDGVLRIGN